MENFDRLFHLYFHDIKTLSTTRRKTRNQSLKTICKLNKQKKPNFSEKLRKTCANQKYRSVYLRRYVYAKGSKCVPCFRRSKCKYILPVVHVRRRPEHPFNIKKIVDNLRKEQFMSQLNQVSARTPKLASRKKSCCSEGRLVCRNWESVRYKNQLDYKERIKMEKEMYLKTYTEKMKNWNKQQRSTNIEPFYQSVETSKVSPNEHPIVQGMTNEELLKLNRKHSLLYKTMGNQHINENDHYITETQHPETNNKIGIAYLAEPAVNTEKTDINDNESTHYIDNNFYPPQKVPEVHPRENENISFYQSNINIERKDLEIINRSDRKPTNTYQPNDISGISRQETYDISIPYNESSILIKVLSPEENDQFNLSQSSTSAFKETIGTTQILSPVKKAKANRRDNTKEGKWIKYIQNIISKSCDPKPEQVNKSKSQPREIQQSRAKPVETVHSSATRNSLTEENFEPRYYTYIKPNFMPVNPTAPPIPPTTNYHNIGSNRRINDTVTNPKIIRPKVLHPTPYYRASTFPCNDRLENRTGVSVGVPQYPPIPHIFEKPTIPQHMNYIYSNRQTNYHHELNMGPNRGMALDIPMNSVMRQPVFPQNGQEQPFIHYRNDFEQIHRPCINPYIRNSMYFPHPHSDFMQSRSAVPRMYDYLNEQHMHPVWFYQNMYER